MISDDDNDGQIIFGDFGDLKLPDICLTGEEKPKKKNSLRKLVPSGHRTRARCVTGAHATAWPTAEDHGKREISAILFTVVGEGSKDQKIYTQWGS